MEYKCTIEKIDKGQVSSFIKAKIIDKHLPRLSKKKRVVTNKPYYT